MRSHTDSISRRHVDTGPISPRDTEPLGDQHVETLIIGAGQAGLATAYHLQRLGRECLVLDAESRVGDGWRHQWDSLRLFSPAWADSLPGMRNPRPALSFPTKDEFADYLEAYAAQMQLPVRLGEAVHRVRSAEGGGYVVTTAAGATLTADNVVICTGSFGRTPQVPDFADQLDPGIRQLHSSEYRRTAQLADGPVLVVGASHSGCDIAYEVAASHPTVLTGRDTGQLPVPGHFDTPRTAIGFAVALFVFSHVLSRRTPVGRKEMEEFRMHGGPRLRVKDRDLADRGVDWVQERVTGVVDGRPQLAGGRVVDAATVIWCTGFRQVFGWVDLPVFGDDGWPREKFGVVDEAPGLYFSGLCFQSAAASMTIHGAGRDAEYVARHIAVRSRDRRRRPVAA
jgi:putative flavoprotein involved in K+ transport